MNLQEKIIILKIIAKKIANKLHCDRHGSCVHFAEIFVDEVNKQYPELLNDFEVIEGYVNVKFGDGIPQEHTWIKLNNGDIIDPTFSQFDKYDKNAQYSKKRTKVYSGQEYYDEGKEGSWFSERRKKLPNTVFKEGKRESIKRILREEMSKEVMWLLRRLEDPTIMDDLKETVKSSAKFFNPCGRTQDNFLDHVMENSVYGFINHWEELYDTDDFLSIDDLVYELIYNNYKDYIIGIYQSKIKECD